VVVTDDVDGFAVQLGALFLHNDTVVRIVGFAGTGKADGEHGAGTEIVR
jgi:hypothetical protein